MILDRILAHKFDEVDARRSAVSIKQLRDQAGQQPPPRGFIAALQSSLHRPALIAECKKASPSKGLLHADYDPRVLARTYADNGAVALSVLTDEQFFQGTPADLVTARSISSLPILRKDFIVDEYQVYEARAIGADAILLIVAALDDARLKAFHRLAGDLGMAALVEVHGEAELEIALRIKPTLIGLNNRNLQDFSVDLQTASRLRKNIPAGVTVVAESGIRTAKDVACVRDMGVDAILVGEALVTAEDVGLKVRELLAG
jgi:indole-3-glycerol phosphate synthase